MGKIGYRAVEAIEERARENGTRVSTERHNVDVSREVFRCWKAKGVDPSAYFLKNMALAGYDVIYILTGVK